MRISKLVSLELCIFIASMFGISATGSYEIGVLSTSSTLRVYYYLARIVFSADELASKDSNLCLILISIEMILVLLMFMS